MKKAAPPPDATRLPRFSGGIRCPKNEWKLWRCPSPSGGCTVAGTWVTNRGYGRWPRYPWKMYSRSLVQRRVLTTGFNRRPPRPKSVSIDRNHAGVRTLISATSVRIARPSGISRGPHRHFAQRPFPSFPIGQQAKEPPCSADRGDNSEPFHSRQSQPIFSSGSRPPKNGTGSCHVHLPIVSVVASATYASPLFPTRCVLKLKKQGFSFRAPARIRSLLAIGRQSQDGTCCVRRPKSALRHRSSNLGGARTSATSSACRLLRESSTTRWISCQTAHRWVPIFGNPSDNRSSDVSVGEWLWHRIGMPSRIAKSLGAWRCRLPSAFLVIDRQTSDRLKGV